MSIFFIIFFTLYSALHVYIFLKAWYAFRFRFPVGSLLAVIFILFIIAPIIVRYLEHGGNETLARIMAYAGFIWMSAVFIFFIFSLAVELIRFFAFLISLALKTGVPKLLNNHLVFFMIPLLASFFITLYGYHEARTIRTERVHLATNKLPEGMDKLTIVQISDTHLGLIIREERLKDVIKAIRAAKPDIVLSTGDLVDGQINHLNGLTEMFSSVEPRYGKYAIMGNHEFYAGVDISEDFTKKAGFKMLRGEAVTVGGVINIAGVDDRAMRYAQYVDIPERTLLAGLPPQLYTILLKHRPVVDQTSEGLFDLQLSGHTHNGQIFPFTYLTRIAFPMYAGLHQLKKGSLLYVSRGTGTWGPPIRFLSPPEVTVIELVRKDNNQ